jgi:hypothetical protein
VQNTVPSAHKERCKFNQCLASISHPRAALLLLVLRLDATVLMIVIMFADERGLHAPENRLRFQN